MKRKGWIDATPEIQNAERYLLLSLTLAAVMTLRDLHVHIGLLSKAALYFQGS